LLHPSVPFHDSSGNLLCCHHPPFLFCSGHEVAHLCPLQVLPTFYAPCGPAHLPQEEEEEEEEEREEEEEAMKTQMPILCEATQEDIVPMFLLAMFSRRPR
jgi:hypothetical protein